MELEVFGSIFNTRCKYFGSINSVDEPWGRVGDAFEILEKIAAGEKIMWRDEIVKTDILYINPPSGINLQYKVYVAVLKILKAVPVKIYLELSKQALKNMYDLESFGEYLISEETLTKAWDFKTGVMVEKKLGPGKEWVRFVLSSV